MTTAAQLMVKVGADVSQAMSGLRQVNDSIGGLATSAGQKLQSVGGAMVGVGAKATAMAAPVAIAMGLAVKTAADFESQMNVLNITMRESGVTGETWSQVALKIGADSELVGISASEAADAITNFGKAGLDTTQILGDMNSYLEGNTSLTGALRAAIDLAAASELDLAAASQAVVQTMNQYGLSFDDASKVMDNFVRTADASTASVDDLVAAHQNVGPVMAQMGFSVEHANVMLAMLADRGIAGAEAGTALKSMFMTMTNPATKAGDALASLGVKLYDANGTMRDAKSIVADLSKALDENAKMTLVSGGATEEQAKALVKAKGAYERIGRSIYEYENGLKGVNLTEAARAKKLAELRQQQEAYRGEIEKLTAAIPGMTQQLVDMTDAQRNAYLQQIAGSYGIKALNILVDEGAIGWGEYEAAIAGATSMQEQAAARTEGFHAAMEQFKSVLETFMITAATPFIKEFLTPFLRKAGDFLQKLMETHPQFAKWAMAIGAVIVVAGPILMFVGSLISALGTIFTVVGGVIGVFGSLAGAIGGVVAAVAAAGAPILLVIGAIIAIVYLLKKAWDENFLGIADALREFWAEVERAFGYVKAIVTSFVDFLKGNITWDEFLTRARIAFERIGEIMSAAFDKLKVRLAEIWDRLKALIVEKLAEFIAPLVGGMDKAREIVTTAFQRIGEFLSNTWEVIKTAVASAWEYIKGIIAGAVEFIRGVIAVALQIISGDWEGAWESVKEAVTRVWDNIKTGIQNALDVIAPAIKTAWENIKTGVTEKVEALKSSVAEKWDQIKAGAVEKWEAVKERITSIVTGIKDFVVNTIGGLVEKAIELFGKLMGALTGGGDGGGAGSPFSIDFSALIASLLNLRENWTLTLEHVTNTLAQLQATLEAHFAAMLAYIGATNTAIHETTTATWYMLRDALLVIWAEVQAAYTTWGQYMLTATTVTWEAIDTLTRTMWTMMRDWLFGLWIELRETYIRRMLDLLAATRQHNQWILQENERTWPKIIDEVVRALLTMKEQALGVLAELSSGVKNALDSIVSSARASGIALGDAFAAGIRASIPAIEAAAAAAAAAARAYLPSSDAKKGPLSDLTKSGRALPKTFAIGMRGGIRDIMDAAWALAEAARPQSTRPFELAKPKGIFDKMELTLGKPKQIFDKMELTLGKPKQIFDKMELALNKVLPTRPFEIAKPASLLSAGMWTRPPQYATRPSVPALMPQYTTRPFEPAQRPSQSFMDGQGDKLGGQCITITINNPTGRPSEESIMLALKKLAAVGILEPV